MSTKGHGAARYVGTNTERVALATGPLTAGTVWIETDTLNIYIWDGTAWQGMTANSPVLIASIDDTDSPYSAGNESVIIVDATSGAVTINLPVVADNEGKMYTIKRIDAIVANAVTVDGDGAETIDDQTTQTLNQYDALKIVSDSAEWWVI